MADWSLIEMTLGSWVTSITGLPVEWQDRPQNPNFNNAGFCLLSITSIKGVGMDSIVTSYDDEADAGEEMITTQDGARTFVFGVQIRTYDQRVDHDAKHYSSLLRDSAFLPVKTDAVLAAADIAIARVVGDTYIGTTQDQRAMSVHQLDFLLNAISSVSDTPTGYISEVKDAELQIPEGTTVATLDFEV